MNFYRGPSATHYGLEFSPDTLLRCWEDCKVYACFHASLPLVDGNNGCMPHMAAWEKGKNVTMLTRSWNPSFFLKTVYVNIMCFFWTYWSVLFSSFFLKIIYIYLYTLFKHVHNKPFAQSLNHSFQIKSEYVARRQAASHFNQHNRWKKRGVAITPIKYGVGFGFSFLCQVRIEFTAHIRTVFERSNG